MGRGQHRIAFDARAWGKPPHSFRRVLSLLVGAAEEMGWQVELWVDGELREEFGAFASRAKRAGEADASTKAEALWSPQADLLPSRLPGVANLHDINPLLPDGRGRLARAWRGRQFRRRTRESLEASWRTVADTEDARSRIADAFPGFDGKLRVVPLYVDPTLARVEGPGLQKLLGDLDLRPGFILFVGHLRRHKNWDGLMRAYAQLPAALRRERPLVYAGPDHRARRKAERLARALGVRDQVRILGHVPDEAIPALYSGAACFAFPSYLEGFGLPPLEAMACGTPVVATNRTCVPEVLGEAPVYVDPDDLPGLTAALQWALEDRALRDRLVALGHENVARFSPERTGRAMAEVLDEL